MTPDSSVAKGLYSMYHLQRQTNMCTAYLRRGYKQRARCGGPHTLITSCENLDPMTLIMIHYKKSTA